MNANGSSLSKVAALTIIISCITALLSYCGAPKTGIPTHASYQLPKNRAAKTPITAPHPNTLPIALVSGQLSTLDFMALGGCGLQITLGKYNSKLGRGASHSQRLLLDLEYLHLAPQCINRKHGSGQPELATLLETTQQQKQQQLPAAIFNATLANTQFQRFWQNSDASGESTGQQQRTLTALQAINTLTKQWLSGDYRASNIEFEIHLSEIGRGSIMPTGGHDQKVLHSIIQLEQLLAAALPPKYRVWREVRGHYFSGLEPLTQLN